MALLTYVREAQGATPMLAVITDDEGVDYIFPDDVEPWLDEERVNYLAELRSEKPTDAQGWMELGTYNLGQGVIVDEPVEVESVEDAVTQATEELEGYQPDSGGDDFLKSVSESFDQVAQDYPGFMEEGDDTPPEAMENFVLMALGPIDPDGPNGWILRAQDGNPAPGDENEYVHFPGEIGATE